MRRSVEVRGRRTRAVAAMAAVALLVTACGTGDEDSDSPDQAVGEDGAPDSLNMLYATVEANVDAVRSVLPAFEEEFGVSIELDSQPYDALQSRVFSELAGESDFYDIVVVDTPWMPSLTNQIEPLGDYLTDPELNDHIDLDIEDFIGPVFYDTAVYRQDEAHRRFPGDIDNVDLDAIEEEEFGVFGLPVQSNVLTMSYRSDLFEDPDEQAAFESTYGRALEFPETWDDFIEVAEHFTRPDERLYGTTLMAGSGEWATTDFKTFLGSWGGDATLVNDDFEVTFDSPEGVEALTFYHDLIQEHEVTPPGATTFSWDEAASSFGEGLTAIGMNYHTVTVNPDIDGEVAYAIVPQQEARGPHFGTWMLSVNAFSNNKEWAYRAISWITAHEQQVAMLDSQLHPTRDSVYEVAGNDEAITSEFGNFYEVLGESLAVGVGRPRLTNYGEVSRAVAVGVNQAASGDVAPEQALSSAADEVRGLLEGAGYEVSE